MLVTAPILLLQILLVSDNDAYNRLYEFVGREEINNKLKKYALNGTRIIGRLAIGRARIGTLEVDDLRVRKLTIVERSSAKD